MRPIVLSNFVLILSLILMQLYSYYRYEFSGLQWCEHGNHMLKQEIEKQKLEKELVYYEASKFKQIVASLIPQVNQEEMTFENQYQLRNLASLSAVRLLDEPLIDFSESLFEKGKELFRNKKYREASGVFNQMTKEFPFSLHLIESYFLLAESQYILGKHVDCLNSINTMLSLFPESELTGHILFRMGEIFESQQRLFDAAHVYRSIYDSYKNIEVRNLAQDKLAQLR